MACISQFRIKAGLLSILFGFWATQILFAQEDRPTREKIGEVLGKPVYRDEIRAGEDVLLRDELHRLFTSPVFEKYRQAHLAEIEATEEEIAAAAAVLERKLNARRKELEPRNRDRLKSVESQLQQRGLSNEERQKLELERISLEIDLRPPGLGERLHAVKEQLAKTDLEENQRRKLGTEKALLEAALKPQGRQLARFLLPNWKFQRHLYDRYGGGRILWQQAGLEAFDATHQWLKAHEEKGDFKITDAKLRSVLYEYWTTMNHGAFLTNDRERIRSEFLEPDWAPKLP
jgi:hypothetical protein